MAQQRFKKVTPEDLVAEVLMLKHEGYRLIQICATRLPGGYELTYSFGLEQDVTHLRLTIDENDEILSISNIYAPSFLYENEIADLFGVRIKFISLDYQGNLYRTSKKTPFK